MTHAASMKVERAAFEWKLPAEFEVKPLHEIELPSKRKALVFSTRLPVTEYDDKGEKHYKMMDGWRVLIVTRTGKVVQGASRYDREPYGTTFTDPLLLGLYVQAAVVELLKTKKTQVTESEPDDE